MTDKICIRNVRAFDPAQNWKGENRDLYIAEGAICLPFDNPDKVIDGGGRPAMAGGVDPCCHLAFPGQVFARMRAAKLPSPEEIGRTYARMGYVHVHHPFTSLLMAHQASRDLNLIPYVDKSFRVSLDLRDMGKNIKIQKHSVFCDEARALIHLTGAIGLFLPFPYLKHKQSYYIQKNVSRKKTFEFLTDLKDSEIFPIALWGMPGLLETEIPLAEKFLISGLNGALESKTALTNAERFLQEGGKADLGLNHGREFLAVDCNDTFVPGTISIDAGIQNAFSLRYEVQQISLEAEMSIFGWGPLNHSSVHPQISLSSISPPTMDLNRISLTTAWMLGKDGRPASIEKILDDRVFNLSDIALFTRLAPCRQLGFSDLGHLKTGAVANVAVYDLKSDMNLQQRINSLSNCWCLIKEGSVVIENGSFSPITPPSKIRSRKMDFDTTILKRSEVFQNPTLRLENLYIKQGDGKNGSKNSR